jgi:nitrite reductase/ring-hydroxylating ferredoxin subunit
MAEIQICEIGELGEGGVRVVTAGEMEIGVIRHNGKYYAYRNHFPHQGGPVCEGVRMPAVVDVIAADRSFIGQDYDRDDIHIVCPWHAYEFHLESGVSACDPKLRLQKINVVEKNGGVFIEV